MKRWGILLSLVCLALLLLVPAQAPAHSHFRAADTVYLNGYIWTVDTCQPVAQAVAVTGDKIVYVGSDRDAKRLVGRDTKVVNLKGKMMMPGLIDSHQHPLGGGASLRGFNLGNIQRTIPDLQALLNTWLDGDKANEPDGWFIVRGYRGALPRGYHLTRADLDALNTERPLVLRNWDGHSLWVNTRALDDCGVDSSTETPFGGYIEKDADGNPTGYFADAAMSLINSHIPPTTPEDPLATAQRAIDALNATGITAVMDAGGSAGSLATWSKKYEEGNLSLRFFSTLSVPRSRVMANPAAIYDVIAEFNATRDLYSVPDRVMVVQAKTILDGVPDYPAQNAFMLWPYLVQDANGNWVVGTSTGQGAPFWIPQAYKDAVKALNLAGWPVHTHSLGDASVRLSLDAYQEAQEAGASKDLRDTIVHLEPVTRSDVWRFGQLNVVANCQPIWFEWDSSTYDAAKDYLGPDRMENIYPCRSFELAGAPVAFGSDWSVDPLMPFYGLERAVTRTAEEWYGYEDMGPLNPWESITLKNAVKHYTMGSAYQLHAENKLGSITKGKFADMIVLDQNIFKVPIEKVDQTKVLTTIFNGEVVHQQ